MGIIEKNFLWVYFAAHDDNASLFHYSEDSVRWKFQTLVYCCNSMHYSTGEVSRVWNLELTNSILSVVPSYSDWMSR